MCRTASPVPLPVRRWNNGAIAVWTMVALVAVSAAAADCTREIAATLAEETDRISDCLDYIAATPLDPARNDDAEFSEQLLVTWGPEIKISRMRNDPYFCDYEYARQAEFEYRQYLNLLGENQDWGGNNPRSILEIAQLLTAAAASAEGLATERRDFYRGMSARFALGEFYNPGGEPGQRGALLQREAAEFAGLYPSLKKARADGRAAVGNMSATARESSIKAGRGVYFSADPFRFFSQQEGRDFSLVCRTPAQRVVVNRSNPDVERFLVSHNIVYHANTDLAGAKMVPTIHNPALVDRAARRRLIFRIPAIIAGTSGRESAYVDKCALPYDNEEVCRPLTIRQQWLNCEDFRRLVGLHKRKTSVTKRTVFEPAASFVPTDLLASVARSDDAFGEQFEARFRECYQHDFKLSYLDGLDNNRKQVILDRLPSDDQ